MLFIRKRKKVTKNEQGDKVLILIYILQLSVGDIPRLRLVGYVVQLDKEIHQDGQGQHGGQDDGSHPVFI